MKKTIVTDFFSDYMQTLHFPKSNPDELITIRALDDELKEKLSPEQLELHQKYIDLIGNRHCDEVDFYFAEGFKLGLHIGINYAE